MSNLFESAMRAISVVLPWCIYGFIAVLIIMFIVQISRTTPRAKAADEDEQNDERCPVCGSPTYIHGHRRKCTDTKGGCMWPNTHLINVPRGVLPL